MGGHDSVRRRLLHGLRCSRSLQGRARIAGGFAIRELSTAFSLTVLVLVLALGLPGFGKAGESASGISVSSLRTGVADTTKNHDGTFTTVVSPSPSFYGDPKLGMLPVDTALSPASDVGYAWSNKAGAQQVLFAATAVGSFVEVRSRGSSYHLELDGALPSSVQVAGESASYLAVRDGLDLRYSALPEGLKEEAILDSPAAPSSLIFSVAADQSAELQPFSDGNGGWRVFDRGRPAFTVPSPSVSEAGMLVAAPVRIELTATKIGLEVAISIDRKWLSSPKRKFPVVVDPTMLFDSSALDGTLILCGSCNASDPISQSSGVGVGPHAGYTDRTVLQWDVSSVPAGVTVSSATMSLFGTCNNAASTPVSLEAHAITAAWTGATPGSAITFDSSASATETCPGNGPTTWQQFDVTSLVSGWLSGAVPNYGVLVKDADETASFEHASFIGRLGTLAFRPQLSITWSGDGVQLYQPNTLHASGAELSWARYSGSSGAPFTDYQVHRVAGSSTFAPSAASLVATIRDQAVTTYRDTTAAAGQTFTYEVLASGNISNPVTVTLPASGHATTVIQPGPTDGEDGIIGGSDAGWLGSCSHGDDKYMYIYSPGSPPPSYSGGTTRALIRMDLREIPAGAAIYSATLALFGSGGVEDSSQLPTVDVHRVTADWSAGSCSNGSGGSLSYANGANWSSARPGVPWSAVGGDFYSTVAASSSRGSLLDVQTDRWETWTVTSLVNDWVSGGAPNLGFELDIHDAATGPVRNMWYRSSEYTLAPSVRPKLTIDYSDTDPTGPTVTVATPAPSSTVSGSGVVLSASASDDRRTAQVVFYVDGVSVGSVTSAPFQLSWDSTGVANGSHPITARATDDAGNVVNSAAVTVDVENVAAPSTSVTALTAPTYSAVVSGDGPAAWWRLGETAGTTAADQLSFSTLGGSASGNEVTDQTRSASTSGDGRTAPDSSFGVWQQSTNLIKNGGFESNVNQWVTGGGGTVTFTRDASVGKFGSASVKIVTGGTVAHQGLAQNASQREPVSGSTRYTVSGWVYGSSGTVAIRADEYNSSGTQGSVWETSSVNLSGGWVFVTKSFTTASTTATVLVRVHTTSAQAITFWADGVQLEQNGSWTPYVETNGATATRSGARVQEPATLIAASQGWIAARVRPGWSSNNAPGAGSGSRTLFRWADSSGNRLELSWSEANTRFDFTRQSAGSGAVASTSSVSLTAGSPVTVIAAWTGAVVKVSINGSAFASVSNSSVPTLSASMFDLGGDGSSQQFDGDLLWVATGRGTLSDSDASSINALGSSDPAARDFPGNASSSTDFDVPDNATYSSTGVTLGAAGLTTGADTAATFNGSSGTVSAAGSPQIDSLGPVTVEAWIRPSVVPSAANGYIVIAERVNVFSLRITGNGSGVPHATFAVADSALGPRVTGSTVLQAGLAYHLVGVFDGTNVYIYVNGALDGSLTTSTTITTPNAQPLTIAGPASGVSGISRFAGVIDDLAVYRRALTASQIANHFAVGGTYPVVVSASSPSGWWRFGEAVGSSAAADESGGGHPLTLASGTHLAVDGAVMSETLNGARFDGVTTGASAGDAFDMTGTGAYTLEAWVSPSTIDSSYRRILSKEVTTIGSEQGYSLYVAVPSATKLPIFGARRYRDGAYDEVTTDAVFNPLPGHWYHVAATFDGSFLRLYVNGRQVAQTTSTRATLNTSAPFVIGAASDGTNRFIGAIDEPAIYTSALAAQTLRSHYLAGLTTGQSGVVSLSASASAASGVSHVSYFLDSTRIADVTSSPWNTSWNTLSSTTPAYDGRHSLTTRVYDGVGQSTSSQTVPVLVANTAGTKYQSVIAATSLPPDVYYDPTAGTLEPYQADVTITNISGFDWPASSLELHARWLSPDPTPTVSDGGWVSVGAIAAGSAQLAHLTFTAPALPDGIDRASYRLRLDLYEPGTGMWFAAKGNEPLEITSSVQRVGAIGLGLERYYQYAGEPVGAGMNQLVNLASGDSILHWTPFNEPGRGLSTVVDLVYNSREQSSDSPLGAGFSLSVSSLARLGSRLDIHPNNSDTLAGRSAKIVEFVDGDGTLIRFTGAVAGDGTVYWSAPAGVHLYLRQLAGGNWALTRPDRVTFTFDADGYPVSASDGNANTITFTETPVPVGEDAGGNAKRITAVTDAGGRSFSISYYSTSETPSWKTAGRVKQLTDHLGEALAFSYYDDGNLRTITQKGGTNADGSLLADRSFVFTYTQPDGTCPTGISASCRASNRANPDPASGPQGSLLYSVRDPRGNETTFAYTTASGATHLRLASRTNRAGQTTSYTYNTTTATTTQTAPLSRVSSYVFDSSGRVTSITNPLSQTTSVTWTADNEPSRITEPSGKHVDFTYDQNGYLTSSANELGQTSQLTYTNIAVDANDVTGKWEAGRTVAHISQLATRVEPNGVATTGNPNDYLWSFAHDTNGNITSITHTLTASLSAVTNIAYNTDGTIHTLTDPNSHVTTFDSYDTNGLATEIHDAAGGVTKASYNAAGNLLWLQDPLHAAFTGSSTSNYRSVFSYDSFGRLGRSSQPKSTALEPGNLIWNDLSYDANDNIVSQQNAKYGQGDSGQGPASSWSYDAMDRVTLATGPDTTIDPAGQRTAYSYDSAGRLLTVTTPNGVKTTGISNDYQTTYGYDALDRATTITRLLIDPATGSTTSTLVWNNCFDATTGDLRSTTSPQGASAFVNCSTTLAAANPAYTTLYGYDDAHRVLSSSQTVASGGTGSSVTSSKTYDANGQVVTRTDTAGTTTTYTYDQGGRLITSLVPYSTSPAVNLTMRKEYDPVGNLTCEIDAKASSYGVTSCGATTDYVTKYTYDALDRLTTTALPKDASTSQAFVYRAYDSNGNLTKVSLPSTATSIGLVAASDLTTVQVFDTGWVESLDDGVNPRVIFDYTAQGQQSSRAPVNNATGAIDLTRKMHWYYLANGLLSETGDEAGQKVTYTYDADGNTTGATEAAGIVSAQATTMQVTSSYDTLDRLVSQLQPKLNVASCSLQTSYQYDLNSAVTKRIENADTGSGCGGSPSPGRAYTFSLDQLGRTVGQVDDNATSATSDDEQALTVYSSAGQELSRTVQKRPSGSWVTEQATTRTHSLSGLLTGLSTVDGSGSLLESHTLSYLDGSGHFMDGNRLQDVFQLKGPNSSASCYSATCTATWTYNARGQLVASTDGLGASSAYVVDPGGNVTQQAVTAAGTTTTTTLNYLGSQIQTSSDGTTTRKYLYDPNGNVACVVNDSTASCPVVASGASAPTGLLTAYSYDYRNRLQAVRSFSGGSLTDSASYVYDPLDRPISETETHSGTTTSTQLVYTGLSNQLAGECSPSCTSSTSQKNYSYDSFGRILSLTSSASGTTSRYSISTDPHGSVSLLLDQSGAPKASYGFGDYGSTASGLTQYASGVDSKTLPYGYTGKRYDTGSGTLDMGARRYAPSVGRFLQRDLYASALGDLGLTLDPLASNRYALTGGNPINFNELDGHYYEYFDCDDPEGCNARWVPDPPTQAPDGPDCPNGDCSAPPTPGGGTQPDSGGGANSGSSGGSGSSASAPGGAAGVATLPGYRDITSGVTPTSDGGMCVSSPTTRCPAKAASGCAWSRFCGGTWPFTGHVQDPHYSTHASWSGRDAWNVVATWKQGPGPRVTAKLTLELQELTGGVWVTIGTGTAVGPAAGTKVSADASCQPGETATLRGVLDIDIIGYNDDNKKDYSRVVTKTCVPNAGR